MASSSVDMMNQKILGVLQKPQKIPKDLEDNLKSATKAFQAKSYTKAAKYFGDFLDANNRDGKYLNTNDETIVLVTYMSCLCSIESTISKNLWDAVNALEKIVNCQGSKYPMVYWALGNAYIKLYRFGKATAALGKCCDLIRDPDVECLEYRIPGSDEIIPESSREGLAHALSGLKDVLVRRHPNAVCCLNECLNFSANESETKSIFFGSPTFVGMVRVTCNNPCNNCIVAFHVACWKAKKESLCSTGKLSDKDVLHLECLTPNCIDAKGVCSTIKKIEIIDDQGSVKATIESRGDDAVKHAKPVSTSKGAIKKQQQQSKPKCSSEPRTPVVRNPKPPVVQKEIVKVEVTEEGDDLQDEQTLKAAVEKLKGLRAKNFGIKDEKIWQPNLSMYGNEFMLKTADALPDPDFSDDRAYDEEKAFVFSYFFEFISNNGPMKLSRLDEKWKEMQTEILGKPCESITSRHVDIGDFLTQSLKFATVGDYICSADKLPEAYYLARNDACEILKFFMEIDGDENSTASSLDDEAAFNDFINQDHNHSTPNSTITNGAQSFNGEPYIVPGASINNKKKCDAENTRGFVPAKETVEPEEVAEVNKTDTCSSKFVKAESSSHAKFSEKNVRVDSSVTMKKIIPPIEVEKSFKKRSHSPELPRKNTATESAENGDAKIQKESFIDRACEREGGNSPKVTFKGAYSVSDIENHLKSSSLELKKDKLVRETKSANGPQNQNASIDAARKTSVASIDFEDSKKLPIVENKTTTLPNVAQVEAVKKLATPAVKDNSCSKSTTNNPDNSKLILEVQQLKDELAKTREEKEKLKNELTVVTENSTIFIGRMAMDLLTKQYDANRSALNAALNELYFEYKLIVDIQKILHTSIGEKLPLNESEFMSNISEVEKLANVHQEKFIKIRDELSSTLIKGNFHPIDLPPEQIPNIPKRNLSDVLQSAFGLYRMHYLKEFQNLQMPKGPNSFIPPHLGSIPPYGPSNVHNNIPKTFNPRPLMNFPNPRNTQPLGQVQQQFGHPHFIPSLLPPMPYGFDPRKIRGRPPPPPIPSYLNYHPPSLSPQPSAAPNHLKNHAAEPPKFSPNPTTQATDQVNDQYPERPKPGPPPRDSNTRQSAKTPFEELQSLIEKSHYPGSHEKIAAPDCKPESSDSIGNFAQSHSNTNCSSSGTVPSMDSEPMLNHAEISNEPGANNAAMVPQTKTPARGTTGHSLDKLMRRLRSHYTGVLELDLLKSIECVRKQHNNSLSKLPIRRIIREADNFIGIIQQKQLCGYVKYQPNQYSAMRSSIPLNSVDIERMNFNSASSSGGSPSKKEPSMPSGSKKQWEPVHIPNDTWIKDPTADSECAICLEAMSNDVVSTLECKHSFHKQCIRDWHKYQTVVGSCPLCRHHTAIDNEFPPLA